jgi:hypothetical protein
LPSKFVQKFVVGQGCALATDEHALNLANGLEGNHLSKNFILKKIFKMKYSFG